jgi:hypothetical protein
MAEASVSETSEIVLSSFPVEAHVFSEGQDRALLMRNGSGPFLTEADLMPLTSAILSVTSDVTRAESDTALEHSLTDSGELELSSFDVHFPIGFPTSFFIWNGSGPCLMEAGLILLSGCLLFMRKLDDFLGKVQ